MRDLELQPLDCGCIRGNVIVKLVVVLFSFLSITAQLEIHEVVLGQSKELGQPQACISSDTTLSFQNFTQICLTDTRFLAYTIRGQTQFSQVVF